MAMIKCPEPECNNIVSDQAAACPKCGCPVSKSEVDTLRFEYERRQRSIQVLHAKISERNRVSDENEETMRRWPDDDDVRTSGFDNRNKIMEQIDGLYRDIADAEREMAEIQQALAKCR